MAERDGHAEAGEHHEVADEVVEGAGEDGVEPERSLRRREPLDAEDVSKPADQLAEQCQEVHREHRQRGDEHHEEADGEARGHHGAEGDQHHAAETRDHRHHDQERRADRGREGDGAADQERAREVGQPLRQIRRGAARYEIEIGMREGISVLLPALLRRRTRLARSGRSRWQGCRPGRSGGRACQGQSRSARRGRARWRAHRRASGRRRS